MISDAVLKAWREERMENVSGKRSCWKGGAYALENVEKGNWSRKASVSHRGKESLRQEGAGVRGQRNPSWKVDLASEERWTSISTLGFSVARL